MKYSKIILLSIALSFQMLFPQDLGNTETDPVNITAMAIIQKYLFAIGGMDNFKSVMDRTTVMSGFAMNQPIEIVMMQKYPNKFYQELQVGEVNQIIYYSDGKGTLKIGDEEIQIENRELERLKIDATRKVME